MAPNTLLLALHAQKKPRKFTCPRTGLELEARFLPGPEVRAAQATAAKEWGDRKIATALDQAAYLNVHMEHQIAVAIFHDGSPIGLEAAQELDDRTKERYASEAQALEDELNPPMESWTDEQFEQLVEDVKKKEDALAGHLRSFDAPTLIAFIFYLGARLSSFETSTLPSSSSSTPSEDSPDPETSRPAGQICA
jgi:hypothetical protein